MVKFKMFQADIILYFLCMCLIHIRGVFSQMSINITVMVPDEPKERPFSTIKIKPAINISVEKLREHQYLRDFEFNVTYVDTKCNQVDAPVEAFRVFNAHTNILFGPVCDYSLSPVARYAPRWNLPIITPGGLAEDFKSNRYREYMTLTRILPASFDSVTESTIRYLQESKWRKAFIITERTEKGLMFRYWYLLGSAVKRGFENLQLKSNGKFELDSYLYDRDKPSGETENMLLDKVSTKFAIVVLCASADSVRDILIKAHELNFDNGEYVFLNIDLFSSKNESERPWYRKGEDERNRKAKKAYEALMTVTLRKPTSKEYKNFSMEVKKRAKASNVNFTYGEEEVNSFVGAFHDAVILYALALNETLAANKSITDGAEITKRMWNRTFEGITGNVSIDDNGDRNADYSLLDMNPETFKFEVVANYFGKDKEYKAEPGKTIHWAGGRTSPPPDTPKCGFDGSKCPPDKPFPEYGIVIIVLGSLLMITVVAAFFIYRHVKLEAELAEMNWRVKWEDIMFGTMENDKKLRRQGSTMSLTRTNGEACAEGRVLIERSDTVDQSWCKCGECDESERHRRVCCRQLELFGILEDGNKCITTLKDFNNIVLNKDVLLAVFIHVMLVKRQRGTAPGTLTACKYRSMAIRQFLCWMHRGQKLKKESRMSIPSCVSRAIHMQFPDESNEISSTSRGSCTTSTFAEIKASLASSCSRDTIAVHLSDVGQRQLFTKTGYYKGAIVAIKSIDKQLSMPIPKPLLLEIKRIKDLQNDHIVRFIGACIDPPNMCIITEYCQKGSLQDVLENEQIKLDWMFRYSLMQDILRGLSYIHSSEIRSHGNLKSTNCVVDGRFVLKITDFGLHALRSKEEQNKDSSHAYYQSLLWTAPELMRMHNKPPEGTQKGDVYSFGIICQEIVYRSGVFYLENLDLGPEEIYKKVKNGLKPYFRPTLDECDCPCDELADVIRHCWREDPMDRPDFPTLKSVIRKLNKDGDKGNILDNLLSRMEQYANNLEALVEERTADYLEQKKKAEDLLYMMLPKSIANQLIRGESVPAENFEAVTIYFSDICGFTALSSESTPFQVVDLLNDLYTTFDSILENFDVYKVETIGDAYMVVSGLPNRNGNLHAREIARMSLTLLNAVLSFKIRHRPNEQLKLRIGIHSGSVCAGVVGLKMPRYCLFGDTVNTASRMESNGLPLRIHVSPFTKEILDHFGTFELELRGPVEMKGKGKITTHWLTGERAAPNLDRESNI